MLVVSLSAVAIAMACGNDSQSVAPLASDAGTATDATSAAEAATPCSDTRDDRDNCGACGHSCLGGICKESKCFPFTMTAGHKPLAIAVDATHLYFGDKTTSTVYRIDKATMDAVKTPETIAEDQPYVVALKALADEQLWISAGPLLYKDGGIIQIADDAGAVMHRSNDGQLQPIVRPANQPTHFALDGDTLYWGSITGLFAAPKTGGAVRRVANVRADAVAVDQTHAYYVNFNTWKVRRVDKTAVDGTTELVADAGGPNSIALDDTAVYVGMDRFNEAHAGGVMRIAKSGEAKVIAVGERVYDVVLDGEFVLYADIRGGLFRVRRDGTEKPELLAEGQANFIATDDRAIYWSDSTGGGIYRLAR